MAKPRQIDGIAADLVFAEAGARVAETRVDELLAHAHRVLDTAEIEGVHDMRVATRRLRAALEVFGPCFPRKRHKALLREVKAVADALGERRDRDVAIASLLVFAESMPAPDRPGIDSLIDRYRAEQRRANEALEPFVAADRLERLREAIHALAADARAAIADGDAEGERS
jgi:CHAD domain-containing protein